jgi:archaellum component FlaC
MTTQKAQIDAQETEPILHLKRPLLPVDEYATRKGLSRKDVEEYRWMGLVQTRKHKGRTFVVDVPLNSYYSTPKAAAESKVIDDAIEFTGTRTAAQPDLTIQKDVRRLGIPKAQAFSKRTWQIAALFSLAFLLVALFANLRLSMERKARQNRLDQAYAGIQSVYNDLAQTKQHTEAAQDELADSRVELERLRNELDKYRTQAENTRDELAQTRQNFETIKRRYIKAIDQLNEKIQELTVRLTELTENP